MHKAPCGDMFVMVQATPHPKHDFIVPVRDVEDASSLIVSVPVCSLVCSIDSPEFDMPLAVLAVAAAVAADA